MMPIAIVVLSNVDLDDLALMRKAKEAVLVELVVLVI
jgi:hypothetical protein